MPQPLWIFAYGSLIWNPGFTPAESCPATLSGWRRAFCMTSVHFRGTADAPGLVLALDADPAACCVGLALRVAEDEAAEVLAAVRARELIPPPAYLERRLTVRLKDGREAQAIAYVIDREGAQYCRPDPETQARVIARATGARGPNRDYLWSTAKRLAELGIPDPALEALAARVRALSGAAGQ